MTAVLLLAMAILPTTQPVVDRVDVIEVSHVYSAQGDHVFSQLLFWELASDGEYDLRTWLLLKQGGHRPEYDFARGDYVARFSSWEQFHEVRAPVFRETWTQYDPELIARDRMPKENRRGLTLQRDRASHP